MWSTFCCGGTGMMCKEIPLWFSTIALAKPVPVVDIELR
jgi:hypothetical protein